VVYNSLITARKRHTMPGMSVPRTTDEFQAKVPFPPHERPVRNSTIPDTKRTRPNQSKVFAMSESVVRGVGLSLRKIVNSAIATPPVLKEKSQYNQISGKVR
jgi:hypothetical protein